MPKPLLQGPGVVTVVGELIAARVPQHVRMDGKGELGRLADRREELTEGRRRHGPAALAGEHVDALGLLALEAPELADLTSSE